VQVPTPAGELTLPLGNGLKTRATWFTADASFELGRNWYLQNTTQIMRNDQEWNAIIPFDALAPQDLVTGPTSRGLLGFPAGSTFQYYFTNHFDPSGDPLPFDTPNGLVAPGGQWHVHKPMSAVQNQLTLRREFGRHSLSLGGYFAHYTQHNRWFFTDILTDVRDNPRFLDLIVTPPGGAPVNVTRNGFRRFLSFYVNGSGHTSIASGLVGGEVQLTDRLRADLGLKVEYNTFVQSAENGAPFDLDGDPTTRFDNEFFGNNTFRHFSLTLTDWSASVGLNFSINDRISVYGSGSRGYKMPGLDEFINAMAQEQVNLFGAREVRAGELGVKYAAGQIGVTLNGFYTQLKNLVGQEAIVDPATGAIRWLVTSDPENRSYGTEIEAFASPLDGLQLLGNATFLEAELGPGIDSLVGARLLGVPTTLGNFVALYSPPPIPGLQLKADWHWVGSRFTERPQDRVVEARLPSYQYFNFGLGLALANAGASVSLDLLNAFQSKGLEEGNPRLVSTGANIFLARPLLPRRLQASIEYDFGGSRP
jgi:outer membrane receptor protein involved in Fe transport